jgi:hypothetical protein
MNLSLRLLFLQFNQLYLLRFFFLWDFFYLYPFPLQPKTDVDTLPVSITDTVFRTNHNAGNGDSIMFSPTTDSISKRPAHGDTVWNLAFGKPLQEQVLRRHPYFNFAAKPIAFRSDVKQFHGKELMFYLITALLMVFALLKLGFAKYFNDLFRVFFRTTLKQRQIKEQLIQTPLPSLISMLFMLQAQVCTLTLYCAIMKLHRK